MTWARTPSGSISSPWRPSRGGVSIIPPSSPAGRYRHPEGGAMSVRTLDGEGAGMRLGQAAGEVQTESHVVVLVLAVKALKDMRHQLGRDARSLIRDAHDDPFSVVPLLVSSTERNWRPVR